MSEKSSERQDRLNKLELLKEQNINPYPAKTSRDFTIAEVLNKFKDFEKSGDEFFIVGRLRSVREHGNLIFADLQDDTGKIQLAISKKIIGADEYKLFCKAIDVGDFIEVNGRCFTTHKGQNSFEVGGWKILTKTLQPIPTEHFGLQDEEEKLRKRYLDILLNPELKELMKKRAKFWDVIRSFMKEKGFFEVETPSIEITTGGAEARPFKTHHNDFDIDVFMRISVGELWQKKLMAAGFEKTFEIGRVFRNEGSSPDHLQEFTNMEFYWAYANYEDGMKLTQELYQTIAKEVFNTTKFKTRGYEFDLAGEWDRIDYREEVKKQTGIDITKATEDEMKAKLAELKVKYAGDNKERLTDTLWKYCRKNIAGPVFLINHPALVSPLAKRTEDNKDLTQRFQIIIAGSEIGNGYSELNNPIDQQKRFEEQQKLLEAGDDEAMMPDWEFVEMLEHGMPPTCGFGFGERFFAFLADKTAREVTLFPLVKPKEIQISKKAKQTDMAVAIINKEAKLESWQEMNTIAHLNAAFGARQGRGLFMQDNITTKDGQDIKLNIQHAIMIKQAESQKEILSLIKNAQEEKLEIAEFTREMLETTDDAKIVKITADKNLDEVEYLGVLVYGKKSVVEKLTKEFSLYK